MRLIFILSLLLTTNAFAIDICSFEETFSFGKAFEAKRIRPVKTSKNHKRFTFLEKEMIHLTVTLQDWLKGASRQEALKIFADIRENGQPGDLAGEILYFRISGKEYAFALYYPGDNEYGAYFELKGSSYKLIAEIHDSEIICK